MQQFFKHPQGLTARLRAAVTDGPPLHVLFEMLTFYRADGDNRLFMSQQTLRELTGYPLRTVQRALACLKNAGLIAYDGGGFRGSSTVWRVTDKLKALVDG